MTLTYDNRESWTFRLERRIERALITLWKRDPDGSLAAMRKQARRSAAEALGICSLLDERDRVLNEGEQLRLREMGLRRQIVAALTGETEDHIYVGEDCSLPPVVIDALEKESRKRLRTLLKETEIGQAVLELKREQRELEDTVMLTKSEAELQSLWARIAERASQPLSDVVAEEAETVSS